MAQDTLEKLQARLTRDYPGWYFWRARRDDGTPGSIMATRKAMITEDHLRAGLARTLPYGVTGTLEEQLAEQTLKEAALLAPQEALQ